MTVPALIRIHLQSKLNMATPSRDEGLPQLNLATVLDQLTGHIVYAFAYNGSINDRGSYSYIYERMKQAGFPMDQIMLISDRGYPSNSMLNKLINDNMAFLTGCPIAAGSNEEKWIFEQGVSLSAGLKPGIEFHRVYSHTVTESWQKSNKTTAKVLQHLFYDPERAQAVRSNLNSLVVQVFDELSHGRKVDQRLFQEARPYLKEVADPKGSQQQTPKKNMVIDQTAVNRIADLAGWLNIKSNVVEDSSVRIDLYRLRGLIEQGFDQLKNQLPGGVCVSRKPRISGKLLVYLIGCDLRLQIRHNLMLQQERGPNWKMELPGNSINKLLMSMDATRYAGTDHANTGWWICCQRGFAIGSHVLFRVDVPAKRFRS